MPVQDYVDQVTSRPEKLLQLLPYAGGAAATAVVAYRAGLVTYGTAVFVVKQAVKVGTGLTGVALFLEEHSPLGDILSGNFAGEGSFPRPGLGSTHERDLARMNIEAREARVIGEAAAVAAAVVGGIPSESRGLVPLVSSKGADP